MLDIQIGLVAAASLAADLVEPLSGPFEVVAIAGQAEVVDFGHAEVVVVDRVNSIALNLALVGHWFVVFAAYSFGVGVAVVVAAE